MLGGFPVRDLDFTVEGNALKLAKAAEKHGATILSTDDLRKSAELRFPGGVTAEIGDGPHGEISEIRRETAGDSGDHS